jgi:hypothetical protein
MLWHACCLLSRNALQHHCLLLLLLLLLLRLLQGLEPVAGQGRWCAWHLACEAGGLLQRTAGGPCMLHVLLLLLLSWLTESAGMHAKSTHAEIMGELGCATFDGAHVKEQGRRCWCGQCTY